MKNIRYGLLFLCYLFSLTIQSDLSGQISLVNRSLEDTPSDATIPYGWHGCEDFTTPDILPGFWGVYLEPSEGNTYVGMITRENGTWESIGQRLSQSISKDNCYLISLDLAYSETYAGYNNPIKLRIYVSSDLCGKNQMIYESPLIDHTSWKKYQVKFRPTDSYKYILFEAFHNDGKYSYKGNLLLDNLSLIKNCDGV